MRVRRPGLHASLQRRRSGALCAAALALPLKPRTQVGQCLAQRLCRHQAAQQGDQKRVLRELVAQRRRVLEEAGRRHGCDAGGSGSGRR